jgi:hypothetical protein
MTPAARQFPFLSQPLHSQSGWPWNIVPSLLNLAAEDSPAQLGQISFPIVFAIARCWRANSASLIPTILQTLHATGAAASFFVGIADIVPANAIRSAAAIVAVTMVFVFIGRLSSHFIVGCGDEAAMRFLLNPVHFGAQRQHGQDGQVAARRTKE